MFAVLILVTRLLFLSSVFIKSTCGAVGMFCLTIENKRLKPHIITKKPQSLIIGRQLMWLCCLLFRYTKDTQFNMIQHLDLWKIIYLHRSFYMENSFWIHLADPWTLLLYTVNRKCFWLTCSQSSRVYLVENKLYHHNSQVCYFVFGGWKNRPKYFSIFEIYI